MFSVFWGESETSFSRERGDVRVEGGRMPVMEVYCTTGVVWSEQTWTVEDGGRDLGVRSFDFFAGVITVIKTQT